MRVLEQTQILRLCRVRCADLPRLHRELGLSKTSARQELFVWSVVLARDPRSRDNPATHNLDSSLAGPKDSVSLAEVVASLRLKLRPFNEYVEDSR
jgi:hypothetical protein